MTQDYASSKRSSKHAPKEAPGNYGPTPSDFAGWISKRYGIAWVVSKHRKDKRTGAVPPPDFGKKVYLLQYEIREQGKHKSQPKFQGIAAKDHIEAAEKAIAFLEANGIALTRRTEAQLYYDEKRIDLWIGQNENDASGK